MNRLLLVFSELSEATEQKFDPASAEARELAETAVRLAKDYEARFREVGDTKHASICRLLGDCADMMVNGNKEQRQRAIDTFDALQKSLK